MKSYILIRCILCLLSLPLKKLLILVSESLTSSFAHFLHIYLCLPFITTFHLSIHYLKCHLGLHNNLIKTKEKRLPSLKPLYSRSTMGPNTTPSPFCHGADICVGGLYCSLVKNCSRRISWSSNWVSRSDTQHGLKPKKKTHHWQ